jgi:hypothetical protein
VSGHYDRQGNPIGMMEWATSFTPDRQAVDKTTLNDAEGREHYVSTVWLGVDHNFGDGPPLIFETMIFCHDHKCDLDEWQDRYSTEDEARVGHDHAVERVRGVG